MLYVPQYLLQPNILTQKPEVQKRMKRYLQLKAAYELLSISPIAWKKAQILATDKNTEF